MFPLLYNAPRGLITNLLFFQIQGAYSQFAQPQFDQGILLVIILVSSIVMTIALVQNGITVRGVTLVPEMMTNEVSNASLAASEVATTDGKETSTESASDQADDHSAGSPLT